MPKLKAIAPLATVTVACLLLPTLANADWSYSWREAKNLTADVVNDRYGVDVLPREVGCLPRPRRKHVTTSAIAHRWDCMWVHTVEKDGDGAERVCSGTIRITGSDDGKADYYYSVVNGKSCNWL
jgi:hypothetical protein